MNLDANGLLVTTANDGGDSCAEEGRFWFLYYFNLVVMSNPSVSKIAALRRPYRELINLLEVSPGIYVRNPLTYNTPNTTSRDQLMPIMFYCAAYQDYSRLWRLFKQVAARGFFAQNNTKDGKYKLPDEMLTCIGYFIRCGGNNTIVFYPLLYIFDTLDLIGTLINLLIYAFRPNMTDVDDNNTDIRMLAAVIFKPTLISYLDRLIWGQFRPKNAGNALGYKNNCLAAMAYYHDPSNQGNIEVVSLYSSPILKYLKRII